MKNGNATLRVIVIQACFALLYYIYIATRNDRTAIDFRYYAYEQRMIHEKSEMAREAASHRRGSTFTPCKDASSVVDDDDGGDGGRYAKMSA